MPFEDLRRLEAAQGYATLGLYLQANQELERMSRESRHWTEALLVKLAIFHGLALWEMVEIVILQLGECSEDNARWQPVIKEAWMGTHADGEEAGGTRPGESLEASQTTNSR